MSDTVIKVENLSKQYRIGAKEGYKTFRETLVDAAKAPFLLAKDIAKKVPELLEEMQNNLFENAKKFCQSVKSRQIQLGYTG